MKVKTRMGLSFGIIIVMFVAMGGMIIYQNYHTLDVLKKLSRQIENASDANLVVRNILSIQEQLTDAALSGDKNVLKEASESRKKAEKYLTEIMTDALDANNSKAQSIVGSVIQQLQIFYSTGINMVNSYLNESSEKGLLIMRKFDDESIKIQELSDSFIQATEKTVANSLNSIREQSAFFIKMTAVIIIAALGFIVFITINTTLFITKPLTMMVDVSKAISEKNLAVSVDYRKNNELGMLGENLNTAVESLRTNISEMQESSDATVKSKDELAASTEETSSAINEISANNVSMRNQINELNRHIMDSTSSITQIDANIKNLGNLIDDQAAMVVQATAAINQMIASINNVASISESKKNSTKQLVNTSRTGGEKLAVTNNVISEISDRVTDIQEMMEIINSIASQTNLLSMNAAIEAAHAGDAGKGFAVVADEIRKLAESTSDNAKNISEVIGTITDNIEAASKAGIETQYAFENIQNEVITTEQALNEISASTRELTVGGEEILKAMTQLSEVSESIKTGAVEMEEGSSIVAGAMNNVEQISGTVTNGMEEVTLGIEEISRAMNDLNDIAIQLGDNSDKLDSIIKQFKV